jgi:hypothetical protein
MKKRLLGAFILIFIIVNPHEPLFSGFSTNTLQLLKDDNDPEFSRSAKAFVEAVEFSTHKTPVRAKLPGSFSFFLEFGASAFDIDDQALVNILEIAPGERLKDSLESLFFKVGTGLPFGFAVDLGATQVLGKNKLTSAFGNFSFQSFDFAHLVYTDMVPNLSVSTGLNYVVSGPSQISWNSQVLIGAYHRFWMAQVSYVFSVSWAQLLGLSPTYRAWLMRHGISSHWPLFEGIFLTTNLFYKPVEAAVSLGYQF